MNKVLLELRIDFADILKRRMKITLSGLDPDVPYSIEALKSTDENFINQLNLDPLSFKLSYFISSPYNAFVGSHVDYDINYPFFNNEEIYIGSGVLPLFEGEHHPEYKVIIENYPTGWSLTSNIENNEIIGKEKASQFFMYLSKEANVFLSDKFKCTIGTKVSLPLSAAELNSFCQNSLSVYEKLFGPNQKIKNLNVLFLQSPVNFDTLTRGKTFSTAENYTGGIAFYGPDREDIFRSLGHTDYKDFILGGLHHELGHAYTTAGPGKFKSLLYPSPICSREDRFLIGEGLNIYFNDVSRHMFDPDFDFSMEIFLGRIKAKATSGRKNNLIDLFLYDCGLRSEAHISLYEVYRYLLELSRLSDNCYDSSRVLVDAAEKIINKKLSQYVKNLILNPDPVNYSKAINQLIKEDIIKGDVKNFFFPGFKR